MPDARVTGGYGLQGAFDVDFGGLLVPHEEVSIPGLQLFHFGCQNPLRDDVSACDVVGVRAVATVSHVFRVLVLVRDLGREYRYRPTFYPEGELPEVSVHEMAVDRFVDCCQPRSFDEAVVCVAGSYGSHRPFFRLH